jgi:6-phosphofructokinase 1
MDDKEFALAVKLRGRSFESNLNYYIQLNKVRPHPVKLADDSLCHKTRHTLAVMNVGAPACGMNAAIRSFVRLAMTYRCQVLGIRFGFEGLLNDDVNELLWTDVQGWTGAGGTNLGTTRDMPDAFGLDKVAAQFKKYNIHGLLIIGGFGAFHSVLMMAESRDKFPEFCIPMTVIPATISNNVPGTDFSLGSDTALNEITMVCDRIKQSASGTKTRVFVIETMGGYCGYLATMSALAGGADAAYIHEEPFSITDLQGDVAHLMAKIKGGINWGLILRNEKANVNYTSDFITRLYSEEGKDFSCRLNVLGHMQQGGNPSPFDRHLGTKMAAKCVERLIQQIQQSETPTGDVYTADPDSASLLGLVKCHTVFTAVKDLKQRADFTYRTPLDNWWLKLRPLLRILAKHDSVYEPESTVSVIE